MHTHTATHTYTYTCTRTAYTFILFDLFRFRVAKDVHATWIDWMSQKFFGSMPLKKKQTFSLSLAQKIGSKLMMKRYRRRRCCTSTQSIQTWPIVCAEYETFYYIGATSATWRERTQNNERILPDTKNAKCWNRDRRAERRKHVCNMIIIIKIVESSTGANIETMHE